MRLKWLMKKHCVAKILPAIKDKFLCEDSRNCNSYKFIYKSAFIYVSDSFIETKNKNQALRELVVWYQKIFAFCL